MRLYLRLSPNREMIPFNYQYLLTGCVHKWIGKNNDEHGNRSLYCFSWLQNTHADKNGISLNRDSYFFISAHHVDFIKRVMKGILSSPDVFCGSKVVGIQIKETPQFSGEEQFFLNSPVLIRKRVDEKTKHVTFKDRDFEDLLTENLKNKLKSAHLPSENVSIKIDKDYACPQTKLVDYKGIKNRTTWAPVIIKGMPEQIAFAWQVGLGQSTGIGFGAIK